jgi:hypothetical protein
MALAHTTRRRQRLRMASGASTRHPPEFQRGCARTEKSCGPDARGSGAKSCGDERPDRVRASIIHKTTGAIVQRSPRRARRTPLKPFAQGRPGDRHTCGPPRVHFYRARISGASRRPAFPAPLSLRARHMKQDSGEERRENASVRLLFEGANGERWPRPWLRHCEEPLRRSNPDCIRGGILDCFAALAMTRRQQRPPR